MTEDAESYNTAAQFSVVAYLQPEFKRIEETVEDG